MNLIAFMLMWVVVAISGITFALMGIRKSIDQLTSEIRSSDSRANRNDEEAGCKRRPDGHA